MINKKKLLRTFNTMMLSRYNHAFFETVEHSKILNLINDIKAHELGYNLIRIGPRGDGGYLIPNLIKNIDACFSPGVGKIYGFERDLLEKGIRVFMADKTVPKPNLEFKNYDFLKKNLGSFNDDETITLDKWIYEKEINKNLLLQMDIEGSEYEVINNLNEENLKKFNIMIIEFHHFEQILTKLGFKIIKNVFDKILKYFDVAHIHPNNCCGFYKSKNTIIPSTIEISFLKNNLSLYKKKIIKYPNELDIKNIEKNSDIILDKSWY